jgi:predicted nucleotidyltransferase
VPLSAIRRYARQIAERFHPEKIILFGSYAYGQPHEESDVDLLVIMPTRNAIDQAIHIDLAFERPFAVDLHVRTPYQVKQGLKEVDCDWFLREVVDKGKVLYEAPHTAMGSKGRGRHGGRKKSGRTSKTDARRGLFSLPTSGGKVFQGAAARTRHGRPSNA